jgi:tRNA threonylcarbamoyladenosine biosynthesis protein TsaE
MIQETLKFWLKDAKMTQNLGSSLVRCLHTPSLTILLDGELGSGKTTLLQGFASALGVTEHVSSPTFALEQRYPLQDARHFVHLDLYRLSATEAAALLRESEDLEGIRCIEWADRLPDTHWSGPVIRIRMTEDGDGRVAEITFADIPLPSDAQIQAWRKDVLLPANIIAHCEAVADLCDRLADTLIQEGEAVRRLALHRAAQLHDVLRFIDFKPGAAPADARESPEQIARWNEIKAQSPESHEEACTEFLRREGFPELGAIVRTHGLRPGQSPRRSIEEDLLFYADKRVIGDRIVPLQERLEDLQKRYSAHIAPEKLQTLMEQAQEIEDRLFPDGAPM